MLGKPKYNYNDYVKFKYPGEQGTAGEGVVYIIDAYGTFEQNEEPSYDILDKSKNLLYKHCRESWIITE